MPQAAGGSLEVGGLLEQACIFGAEIPNHPAGVHGTIVENAVGSNQHMNIFSEIPKWKNKKSPEFGHTEGFMNLPFHEIGAQPHSENDKMSNGY